MSGAAVLAVGSLRRAASRRRSLPGLRTAARRLAAALLVAAALGGAAAAWSAPQAEGAGVAPEPTLAEAPGLPAEAAGGPAVSATADEAEVRRRVERLYDNPRNQERYPDEEERRERQRPSVAPWLGSLLGALTYVAIGVGALVILYLLADVIRSTDARRRRALTASVEPVAPSEEEEPDRPAALPDPETLAGEGRFGEAVHALLLHAVPLLDGHRRSAWPPGTTGREMVASVELEPAPRRSLALLVAAVEHFLFARHPLTEEDWLVCRGAFDDLRRAIAAPVARESPA